MFGVFKVQSMTMQYLTFSLSYPKYKFSKVQTYWNPLPADNFKFVIAVGFAIDFGIKLEYHRISSCLVYYLNLECTRCCYMEYALFYISNILA